MKALFEYLPLVAFFALYKFKDIYWATGSLIVTSALLVAALYIIDGKVAKRHWLVFAIALVFGSLTLFFHDDTFIKWKVTLINASFALGLVISQYGFGKNPLKELLGHQLKMPDSIWQRLSLSWAAFFLFCALLNLYVAFYLPLNVWVNFKVFGLTGLTFLFAIGSMLFVSRYAEEVPSSDDNN